MPPAAPSRRGRGRPRRAWRRSASRSRRRRTCSRDRTPRRRGRARRRSWSRPTRACRPPRGRRSGSCRRRPRAARREPAPGRGRGHRPGRNSSTFCLNDCLMMSLASGRRRAARAERLGLLDRDVGRQRRDPGSVTASSTTGRSALRASSQRGPPARPCRRGCPSARAAPRSARTGSPGDPGSPSNFASPSIARCSQVTWLRSWLLSTSTTSRWSRH